MNRKQPEVNLNSGLVVRVPRHILDALHEAVLASIEFQHFGRNYEIYYSPDTWREWLDRGLADADEIADHANDVIDTLLDGNEYIYGIDPASPGVD